MLFFDLLVHVSKQEGVNTNTSTRKHSQALFDGTVNPGLVPLVWDASY